MTRPVAELSASLREHKPLILLVAAFVGVCVLLRLASGYDVLRPIDRITVLLWMRFTLVGLALPLGYHMVYFHVAFFIGLIREPESYSGTLTRRFAESRHFISQQLDEQRMLIKRAKDGQHGLAGAFGAIGAP